MRWKRRRSRYFSKAMAERHIAQALRFGAGYPPAALEVDKLRNCPRLGTPPGPEKKP